jgi:hypothetical protein
MVVNQAWLRKKLKRRQKQKRLKSMENTNNNEEIVEVNVTGVSMSGKAEIKNEHSRTPQEDQEKVEGAEISTS